MKNSLLYCLAAASLALSFCFEPTPDASLTPRATAAPAVAEASLLPSLPGESQPAATPAPTAVLTAATPATRDSLRYHYLAQTLGVKLNYNENPELLQTVIDWVGTPYSYGSSSRRGTDCSGFVSRVFHDVYGITLQRSSRSMFGTVKQVKRAEMKTGDLVFFAHGRGSIYHVGIYLKDGRFAHAACGTGVIVSSLHEAYYAQNFYAAGRVSAAARADEPAAALLASTTPAE